MGFPFRKSMDPTMVDVPQGNLKKTMGFWDMC
jgi:hypothetical protein